MCSQSFSIQMLNTKAMSEEKQLSIEACRTVEGILCEWYLSDIKKDASAVKCIMGQQAPKKDTNTRVDTILNIVLDFFHK